MFTYSDFVKIINKARDNNYQFAFFHEAVKIGTKTCILRHDIDNSPEAALEMARLEKKLGIKATYFFMTASASYNIMSLQVRDILKEIKGLGHEIGLHFFEGTGNGLTFKADIARDAAIIENIIGSKVKVVSFHQPSGKIIKNRPTLHKRLNVYRAEDTGNAWYISDSNMSFRGQDPLEKFADKEHARIQLLIHPMWWRKTKGNARQRWTQALSDRVSALWESWRSIENSFGSKWPKIKLKCEQKNDN